MPLFGMHSFAEFTTFVTFVLLGMSIMMVISAVTSAPDFVTKYYMFATGNPNAVPENKVFWTNVNTFYNVGTYIAQLTFEPMALIPLIRRIPLRLRLTVGLFIPLLELMLLIVIPAVKIPTQKGAMTVLMVISVLGGFSKALCDSCTNALVGPFPTKFMNGAMWGLALSALFMSVLQIILMKSMGDSYDSQLKQSRIYLGIGVAMQLLSIFMFLILPKNPFAAKYIAEFRVMNAHREQQHDNNNSNSNDASQSELKAAATEPTTAVVGESDNAGDFSSNTEDNAAAAVLRLTGDADGIQDKDQVENITSTQQMMNASIWPVIKKVYPMLLCALFVFFVTMLLFPGVFFAVNSDGTYKTMIVLLFNIGDFVARIFLMIRVLRPSPMMVVFGTIARPVIVVPLLVLCVRGIIKGVWMPYILISLHGLSNAYFGAMAIIHCPRTRALHTAGERSLAGILTGVCLMIGLCFGSNFALLVNVYL